MDVVKRRLRKRLHPAHTVLAVLIFGSVGLLGGLIPSIAQEYSTYSKSDDPNLKHFYMGRQEIEIFDTSPIVKYRGSAGDAGQQPAGASPQGPIPLPPSGFQQYSSNVRGGPLNLPKVENGVPPKAPPPKSMKGSTEKSHPHSARAHTTTLSRGASSSAAKPVIKTYKQTYQTRPRPTATQQGVGLSSIQRVRGKLLPWATNRRTGY